MPSRSNGYRPGQAVDSETRVEHRSTRSLRFRAYCWLVWVEVIEAQHLRFILAQARHFVISKAAPMDYIYHINGEAWRENFRPDKACMNVDADLTSPARSPHIPKNMTVKFFRTLIAAALVLATIYFTFPINAAGDGAAVRRAIPTFCSFFAMIWASKTCIVTGGSATSTRRILTAWRSRARASLRLTLRPADLLAVARGHSYRQNPGAFAPDDFFLPGRPGLRVAKGVAGGN